MSRILAITAGVAAAAALAASAGLAVQSARLAAAEAAYVQQGAQLSAAEDRASANARAVADLKYEQGRSDAAALAATNERKRWQAVAATAQEKFREAPPSADVPLDPSYRAALCSLRDSTDPCS